MASREGADGTSGAYPEHSYRPDHAGDARLASRTLVIAGIGILAAGAFTWAARRRRRRSRRTHP
jgi:hypothetical protein